MTLDTLWYSSCPGPNAVGIAAHHGWLVDEFAADGVTVRTVTSAPVDRDIVRDAHQLAPRDDRFRFFLRHGGNPPPLIALSRGSDIRIVGLTWTEGTRRVLARDDAGITSAADLKGRRLAVPRRSGVAVDYIRSVTLRTYAVALASVGLSFDDVTLVDLDAGAWGIGSGGAALDAIPHTQGLGSPWSNASTHRREAEALIRGEVDVVAAEHAQAVSLQATHQLRTVFDTADGASSGQRASGDQPLVLSATAALIDERPDVVARFIARSLDAADWAAIHREDARRIAAADVGLPEGLLDTAYSSEFHHQLGIDLDARSIDALRVQAGHLQTHGFLAGPVDIDAAIDAAPLAAAHALRSPAPGSAGRVTTLEGSARA
jgi:ABC-type nitrate/sulfonate/bicarbonate transport system substrate-binding protein